MDVVSKFIDFIVQIAIVLVGLIAIAIGEMTYNYYLRNILEYLGFFVIVGLLLVNLNWWNNKILSYVRRR